MDLKFIVEGTWMVQLLKCLTLYFVSGRDLMVREVEPQVGLCTDSVEPAWDSLSLSLSLCLPFPPSLALKINK